MALAESSSHIVAVVFSEKLGQKLVVVVVGGRREGRGGGGEVCSHSPARRHDPRIPGRLARSTSRGSPSSSRPEFLQGLKGTLLSTTFILTREQEAKSARQTINNTAKERAHDEKFLFLSRNGM